MNKRNITTGVIFILIGIFSFLSVFHFTWKFNVVLLIGACFIAAYIFSKRQLGFLIPGCILLSIGIHSFLTDNNIWPNSDGEFFLILLGCAFLAVMLVHTMWLKTSNWGEKYWPIFPGGVLVLIGTLAVLDKYNEYSFWDSVFKYGLPLLLIAIGIKIIFFPSGRHGNNETSDRTGSGTGGK